MIPTAFEKCGYERQEEGMIPMAFEKRGYESRKKLKYHRFLENMGICNTTIEGRIICLRIIGRYKIV